MRTDEEIRKDGRKKEDLIIEVLLDIRRSLNPLFKCEACGKEFKHRIALEGHKRSHN